MGILPGSERVKRSWITKIIGPGGPGGEGGLVLGKASLSFHPVGHTGVLGHLAKTPVGTLLDLEAGCKSREESGEN